MPGDAAVNTRKDKTARALLLGTLPGDVLLQVATNLTAREVWDSLKVRFVGADRVRSARLATLRGEFDRLKMADGEALDAYAGRLAGMTARYANLGEKLGDAALVKKLLDTIRLLCRGKSEPLMPLCAKFNVETDDGRNMKDVSQLLSDAINSIMDVKEESDIDSLFSAGGTSALMNAVSGLDDFELICFLAVK